jgi:hypothetical protein
VSMEFDSSVPDPDEPILLAQAVGRFYYPTPIDDPGVTWFDSEREALDYAGGEYSEYGVRRDVDEDSGADTRAARVEALLKAVVFEDGMVHENDHENEAVVLHFGTYKVRIEGATHHDSFAFAGWLDAVLSLNNEE